MARSVAVVGGGALGLTVALRLAQAGEQVTVIERERELGGLAAGFPIGRVYLEKFYHHLFRSDREIVALIEELGLGPKLEWHTPNTSTFWGGRIYHNASPVGLLTFTPLPLVDRLRMAAVAAYLKVERNYHRFEGKTAARWIRKWMGRNAYRVQWEPVLKGKFGQRYQEIALPWFWSRVHCRSFALGYLRGGFQQLYDRLGERIHALGGEIDLGRTVTRIRRDDAGAGAGAERASAASDPSTAPGDGPFVVETDGWTRRFDRVVCTLPPRLLLRLAEGLPDAYRQRYDWGEAYGAHCVILELDRSLTDAYWLNMNDPGFPFLVYVEHTNMMPREDYGCVPVYLGNYLPMNHPLFHEPDEAIVARYLPHLTKLNPAFDPAWVKKWHVFKAPFAQPIVTTEYRHHIPPFETPIPGLFLGSMFQIYPEDRGQNYSVKLANQLAKRVLSAEC